MTEQSIQDRYFTLLKQYVAQPGEERLAEAAELGRTLVKADMPPEEIGELHEAAVCRLAEQLPGMRLLDAATLISTPLMELFMAYGLAFREQLEARRRAEQSLRETEAKYRNLFEHAKDAIILAEAQTGIVIDANRAACNMLGLPKEKILGIHQSQLHPPEEIERYKELFREHVNKGVAITEDVFVQRPDGKRVPVDISASVVELPGKRIIQGSFRDITERKQAEEELRRARDELELRVRRRTAELATANARLQEEMAERVRSERRERQLQAEVAHVDRLTTMGEMASGLAHELNQPLAAIVVQAETLPHYLPPDSKENHEKLLQSLKFLAEQAHRAGDLIRRMRHFAQKIGPRRSTVAFREIVDEVLPLVEIDLRQAGIALTVEIEQSVPHIFGDKIQLQQVLLNLLRNAMEAMQDTEIDQRRLSIDVRPRDGLIEVAVRDTGCGITADKVDRIDELFTTFYTTKPEGMGMGLGIARSIVESHGGQIWAAPNPDRGATFTFSLPIPAEVQEDKTEAVRLCSR